VAFPPSIVSGLELDEDALAWAVHGGRDHLLPLFGRDRDQALGSAGIVADAVLISYIGDSVLEDYEHFRAVIDAQTIACTEVLIDPHLHGSRFNATGGGPPHFEAPAPSGALTVSADVLAVEPAK
jgi:hypothetical protein